jgi:hypothetical protein
MADRQVHYVTDVVALTLKSSNSLFNVLYTHAPFLHAYCVYVSRLVRSAGEIIFACRNVSKRGRLVAKVMLLRGCGGYRLGSSFCEFHGRCGDLVCNCKL